ncbi:MAG: hypothetical protein AB9869_02390 [Verrucomicrobiia bacterium]
MIPKKQLNGPDCACLPRSLAAVGRLLQTFFAFRRAYFASITNLRIQLILARESSTIVEDSDPLAVEELMNHNKGLANIGVNHS